VITEEIPKLKGTWDSSVGIASGWSAGDRLSPGTGGFPLFHRVQTGPGTHLASYSMGTGSFWPRLKRLGREANNLPPSSAEVSNGAATSPPLPWAHGVMVN
jgi:hypothetical protein